MKKLQLFALIASLGTVSSQVSAWSWNYGNVSVTTIYGNNRGVTIINGQVYPSNATIIKESGKTETKNVDITGVKNIDASAFGNLTIEQCATCPEILTVTADENIMPHLKHELSGIFSKQLNLGLKDNVAIQALTPINFHAIVKDINNLSSSGTMDIRSTNTLKTNALDIHTSGAGNINLSIDVDKVTLNHSGAGNTELSGTATEQKVNFSGTGTYNAYRLHSQNASLRLSGVGTAYVNVKNKLAYRLSGVGSIYYKGNPELDGSVSGVGQIKKAW